MTWQEVWEKRELASPLEELLKYNGHADGVAKVPVGLWIDYVNDIKSKMGIAPEDSVYEVGCGAGAFLSVLNQWGRVGGCDFSSRQIEKIQEVIPHGCFDYLDARELEVIDKYDFVVSNSVFQYLGKDEAMKVFEKMRGKAKKGVGVFDIPNRVYEKQTEFVRSQGIPDYKERYEGLAHTYYDVEDFKGYDPVIIQGMPSIIGRNRFGVIIWV